MKAKHLIAIRDGAYGVPYANNEGLDDPIHGG